MRCVSCHLCNATSSSRDGSGDGRRAARTGPWTRRFPAQNDGRPRPGARHAAVRRQCNPVNPLAPASSRRRGSGASPISTMIRVDSLSWRARPVNGCPTRHAHRPDLGQAAQQGEARLAIAGLADDADVGLLAEDQAEPRAHQFMVVDDHDVQHRPHPAWGTGFRVCRESPGDTRGRQALPSIHVDHATKM